MRGFVRTALVFAALSVPAAAHAQLGVGISLPQGDLADVVDNGYHGQVSFGLSVPLLPVAFRADGIYNRFDDKEGGTFSSYGGMANVELGIPMLVVRPYAIGGVGYFGTDFSEDSPLHLHSHADESGVGYGGGVGLRAGLGPLGVFGEVRYLAVGDYAWVPITVGIRF